MEVLRNTHRSQNIVHDWLLKFQLCFTRFVRALKYDNEVLKLREESSC